MLLAVRPHLDRARNGIARHSHCGILQPRRHLKLLRADPGGPDAEVGDRHLPRRDVDLLGRDVAVEREPGVLPQLERDALGPGEIVVDGDGDREQIALRYGHRKVKVDEEVPEDADRGGRGAERAALGRGKGRHAPGRDRIGQGHADRRTSRPVGDQRRVRVERFGEEAANARHAFLTARWSLQLRAFAGGLFKAPDFQGFRALVVSSQNRQIVREVPTGHSAGGPAANCSLPHGSHRLLRSDHSLEIPFTRAMHVGEVGLRAPEIEVDRDIDVIHRPVAPVRTERTEGHVGVRAPTDLPLPEQCMAPWVEERLRSGGVRRVEGLDFIVETFARRRAALVELRHGGRKLPRRHLNALRVGCQVGSALCFDHFTAELGSKVPVTDRSSRGEQHVRRALALHDLNWLGPLEVISEHSLERELVDLVARSQKLFLQRHEDFLETGMPVREREDCLVDDLDTERGCDGPPSRVRHTKVEPGLLPRPVRLAGARHLDLELVGRVDVEKAAVRDEVRVGRDLVGAHFDGSGHLGCQVDGDLTPPTDRLDGPRDERLGILDDIYIDGPPRPGRQRLEAHCVADLIDGVVGPQPQTLRLRPGFEPDLRLRGSPPRIGRAQVQCDRVPARADRRDRDSAGVRQERRGRDVPADGRLGGRPIRIGGEDVDAVLQARQQLAAFGNGHDQDRPAGNEDLAGLGLCVLGRVPDINADRDRRAPLLGGAAGEKIGQLSGKGEPPLRIGPAGDAVELDRCDVEG